VSNKTFSVEHGAFIDNEVDIHGATPLLKLTDTDTTNLQHTLSSSAGLVISADANNVEASSTIDFAVDGSTVGTLGPTGDLTLTSAASPTLRLTDTTNTVTASVYAQDADVFYGSTTNHATNIGSNNTTAIAIDTLQNVTISGTLGSEKITATVDNNTTALDLQIGTNADFIFTADSTSGYVTTLNMDDTGLDIGHDSVSRSLNLITNSLDRLTVAGGGNVGINNTNPTTAKLVVDGDDNAYTIRAEGGATTGQSYGMRIRAGSNASDTALLVENKAANTTFMEILGDGSVNINGNLTVSGTTTSITNTNTTITDALIELGSGNAGANSNDLGLILERGTTGDNGFIGFDESADQFVVATTTATGGSTGDLTLTDANFRANQITTTYANNSSGVMRNIYESTSNPTAGDGQVGDVWIVYNV